MRKSLRNIFAVLFVVSIVACQTADVRTITILHTNDIHARTLPDAEGIGGYSTIAAYVKNTRARQDNVLVLDAGDQITGSPVSLLWDGAPIYEMMNTLSYDAVVLGNHEFDHGWERIRGFMDIAEFPLLCANILAPDGSFLGDAPTCTRTVNGVRVAIIGVVTSRLPGMVSAVNVEGLTIEEEVEAVRRQIAQLTETPDLLVILSHCGLEVDKRLAQEVKGIDVIVGGHDHKEVLALETANGVVIVQADAYGKYVGRLDLEIDVACDKVIGHKSELVLMDSKIIPRDPETERVVHKWEEKVSDTLDVIIGHNAVHKRPGELAEIIATVLKDAYKTDYGYQGAGSTRASLPVGPITKRQIWNMLPFGNRTVVVRAEGTVVKRMLDTELPIPSPRLYTIATSAYLAEKLCGRFGLSPDRQTHYPQVLRELIIAYIEKHGSLEMPATTEPVDAAA